MIANDGIEPRPRGGYEFAGLGVHNLLCRATSQAKLGEHRAQVAASIKDLLLSSVQRPYGCIRKLWRGFDVDALDDLFVYLAVGIEPLQSMCIEFVHPIDEVKEPVPCFFALATDCLAKAQTQGLIPTRESNAWLQLASEQSTLQLIERGNSPLIVAVTFQHGAVAAQLMHTEERSKPVQLGTNPEIGVRGGCAGDVRRHRCGPRFLEICSRRLCRGRPSRIQSRSSH